MEVAEAIDAVAEMEDTIIELLRDDDHHIRAQAARVLAQVSSEITLSVLREALNDRSVTVREAARQSLRELAEGRSQQRAAPIAAPVDTPAASQIEESAS